MFGVDVAAQARFQARGVDFFEYQDGIEATKLLDENPWSAMLERQDMFRALVLVCLALVPGGLFGAPQEPAQEPKKSSAAKRVAEITKKFDEEMKAFWEAFELLPPEERNAAYAKIPKSAEAVEELLQIARDNAGKPAAFDALEWSLRQRLDPESSKFARSMLAEHYLSEPRLGGLLGNFSGWQAEMGEFLRMVLEKSPERTSSICLRNSGVMISFSSSARSKMPSA